MARKKGLKEGVDQEAMQVAMRQASRLAGFLDRIRTQTFNPNRSIDGFRLNFKSFADMCCYACKLNIAAILVGRRSLLSMIVEEEDKFVKNWISAFELIS